VLISPNSVELIQQDLEFRIKGSARAAAGVVEADAYKRTNQNRALYQRATHEIETNYASQTHPSAYPAVDTLAINPNSPLSRDPLARKAIAYAIDRARVNSILNSGSSVLVRPTCQLVPPNFPGYRPYCRYTLRPGPTWTAPNTALALKLARRSPSYGKPVSVFSWYEPTSGRYIVELLNTLGFRARLVPAL